MTPLWVNKTPPQLNMLHQAVSFDSKPEFSNWCSEVPFPRTVVVLPFNTGVEWPLKRGNVCVQIWLQKWKLDNVDNRSNCPDEIEKVKENRTVAWCAHWSKCVWGICRFSVISSLIVSQKNLYERPCSSQLLYSWDDAAVVAFVFNSIGHSCWNVSITSKALERQIFCRVTTSPVSSRL